MTTQSWSSAIAHSSDATFRAWGSEFATKAQAAGLTQTADTGQINWTTVLRPAINTAGGYEIYRFSDTLQATAPIFIKIEYGTGSSATFPGVWVTVGTSTDGAGTITGSAISTRTTCGRGVTPGASNYPSYLCYKDGYFSVALKVGGAGTNISCVGFTVARTNDAVGAWDSTGYFVYTASASGVTTSPVNTQAVRTAATAGIVATSNGNNSCVVPYGITSSLIGSDIQAFVHWVATPRATPTIAVCTHVTSEISLGSTFTTTLVGTTARTYLSIGVANGVGYASSALWGLAMLWE